MTAIIEALMILCAVAIWSVVALFIAGRLRHP
jgi:hypothetical protein